MTAVRFSRVTKAYRRGSPVLREVDLDVARGAFVSLVGPSGCGKSTMLNLVAGFEQPTSGEILLDGKVVGDRSPRDRGVAMVFQSYALYPHLDVRRNIGFPLDIAGVPRAEIERRVREIAARLDIEHLLDRRPRDLSGGQRQRVALGRALVRRTELCLFDEPLSNLDPSLRGHMRAEIKKLHEEAGATFLYVTHDHVEAMTMSDRIAVLSDGIVQQYASPREIYEDPANMFVASFIGAPQVNLVHPATLQVPAALVGDRDLVAGIRPENVAVGAGHAPEGAIPGRVYVVEPMGAETWVTLEIGSERVMGRARADAVPRSGELGYIRCEEDKILLFDAQTGKACPRSPLSARGVC